MSLMAFFGLSANADRDPTSGFWYGPVARRTVAGLDVNDNIAMNYSACWAATRVLCATGSTLPLNLLRNRQVEDGHPVHRVIHHEFNPEMGSMISRSFGINMQVNRGNFYAEIVRERGSRGAIKELWPIHESRVQPMRFDDDSLGYRVRNDDGTTDDLTREQMFHVPSIISVNGITGKGVIQNARESIGSALAVQRHGASFFGNGAMPGVIIKGGKFRDKNDREDYRRQWMEVHGGPDKSMKPALLPEGADVSFLTFNARDSQFLELREHDVNEFARWYGVPPHMIYDLRRATFTNIEHQSIDFVVHSLVPWLTLWEQEIWRKLLTPEEQRAGYYPKHSVEGLLRGDSAARSAFYKALFEIGVLTINEIRELEDRNGIGPDGDKHFVPLNMTTADKAGMEEPEPAAPTVVDTDDDTMAQLIAYTVGPVGDVVCADTGSVSVVSSETTMPVVAESPVLVERCEAVIAETVGRMLNKECRACRAAAENNPPAKFYGWLDDYYDRYAETFSEAIRKHVEILMIATGDQREPEAVVSEYTAGHVAASKESILQATEVTADLWREVPERISQCGEQWQATRTAFSLGAE